MLECSFNEPLLWDSSFSVAFEGAHEIPILFSFSYPASAIRQIFNSEKLLLREIKIFFARVESGRDGLRQRNRKELKI